MRLLPRTGGVLPWLVAGLFVTGQSLSASEVDVRLSFKFILNASGNRPATGNINTEAEIIDQIVRGNEIFRDYISEFRLQNYEILDVSGESAYYLNTANATDRDEIRNAALADPSSFHWRNNAVNVYITGANGSAISKFPPNNDIIILCQGVYDTTVAHEAGHSLNLYHTHETAGSDGGDECTDTLHDDDAWNSRDQMAQYSYGLNYTQLNAGQKTLVDNTWNNLMSYHDPDNRSVITPCQMDRQSAQGYTDRTRLLTKIPTYIRVGAGIIPFVDMGSWTFPYPTVQDAIDAGETANRVLVLMTGTHADPSSVINTDTDMITRRGVSTIREVEPAYDLPYNLEDSTNAAVRRAVIRAQQFDKQGSKTNALAALKEAAQVAKGREREALLLEIGQRLNSMKRFPEAEEYFTKVAEEADQPALRARGLKKAGAMKVKEQKRLEKLQQAKPESEEKTEEEQ